MADVTQANCVVTVRSSQGRRKFRVAQVTSDASGTTIPASLLGMSYIDHAILSAQKSAMSDTSDYNYLTDDFSSAGTITVTMAGAGSSGAVMDLQAWGW
jgi:hypothetical protein